MINPQYTAEAIEVLSGLDPVRMRPGMYTNTQNPNHLWQEAMDNSADEGTEPPFSSPLNDEHRSGIFSCAGCAQQLYSSKTKFDSHTGWPSFWQPLSGATITKTDSTFGMSRTEVRCHRCGGHLGHVFEDGPKPTGLRYCMNGAAMTFTASTT